VFLTLLKTAFATPRKQNLQNLLHLHSGAIGIPDRGGGSYQFAVAIGVDLV
jgi:hypothetical protein